MTPVPAGKPPAWRRILSLTLWLSLLPPVGLWMLWRDQELAASVKWRILIYLFTIPLLAYLAAMFWTANHALERLLP